MRQRKPIIHGRDHLTGAADPIPGLLVGGTPTSWVEIMSDADLTGWWRLGDTFTLGSTVTDAAVDSADYDDDSPRSLDYDEASLGGRATLEEPNPNLGVDDDGAVFFPNITLGSGFSKLTSASYWDTTLFGTTGDQARTFFCWVKTPTPLTTIAYQHPIVGRWGVDVGAAQVGWVLELDRTDNRFRWRHKNNVAELILTGPVVELDTWYAVAGTYDGTSYTLWLNGLVVDSEAAGVMAADPSTPRFGISRALYKIGVSSETRYFYGTVDEVALWKRALAVGEIETLAAGPGALSGATAVTSLAAQGETGLTGDITLSEGTGVTLTQAGQDIEIAAAAAGVESLAAEGETPLTGDVTLSAGANITLTQAGQDIELAAAAAAPADDTQVWMPLTTVTGGVPDLVWDGDDQLIPTITPLD